ncbi:MAG: SPFH domain-containing protein, partial [Blastochloris sp.]|nr:SPFH domain-containing protein [Blastochloris sp.]
MFALEIIIGIAFGLLAYFVMRVLAMGLFTVDQNERAVITSFGRAQRIEGVTSLDDPSPSTPQSDRDRYIYP